MSWLTDTLIATGVLIALVLVLRRPVARWFGPGMAYALWTLPLLRLVLPPLVLPAEVAPAATITILAEPAAFQVAASATEAAAWPLTEIAVVLWLSGALAFLGWRVWSYRRMRRDVLAEARPVGEVGAIRMVESPAVPAPVAFGLRDKVIALPAGFMASEDRTARDLAIAHELEHHAGRDIAVNFAMQPLLALHWFNPIAWLGWRALRRDQEAACDARVLAGRGAEARAVYARLIADYAQGQRFALAAPLACAVVGEKSIIYRLRSLTMTQPSPNRRRIGRLLITAGALALPLTATITYAASEPAPPAALQGQPQTIRKVTIIDNPTGSSIDDKSLHTRMVVRDGQTIVYKSTEPLSDAELDARIDRIDWAPPEPPEPPEPPAAPGAPSAPAPPEPPIAPSRAHAYRVHTSVVQQGPDGKRSKCDAQDADADVDAESRAANHRYVIKARVCKANAIAHAEALQGLSEARAEAAAGRKEALTEALTGLREARDEVAADPEIPAGVRSQVLKELDDEIERISKRG